jgi:RNA polymerase sigma-70 factor (ECF subfamily)
VDICDGELVRRARAGDAGAFALLVERHFPSARALAARLCAHRDDVDDIVQEAFLQAFTGLGRLRDPDRFGAWLAGIIRNISRAAARQAPLMLLAEWPEDLHPASAQGLPSAEDLDRAAVLRAAVAGLPGGQRRAVELYYFADLPAGRIGGSPGAAKASLHKARRRLREHITARRPDLIPAVSRRKTMTTVRIAHAEAHFDPGPDGTTAARRILVVLADDPGRRAMGLWLPARQAMGLWQIPGRPPRDSEPSRSERHAPPGDLPVREFTVADLATRLLGAAGAAVTGVDIDELGPGVLAAQIGVAGPAGPRQVAAPPGSALALAAAMEVPVRVADALMDRLAVPVTGGDLAGPFASRAPAGPSWPRYGPRNLAFADGLEGWVIGGSSRAEVTGTHWDDYTVAAADGTATLSAAVPQPYGDVFAHQMWIAGEYRGATVTLAAEISAQDVAGHAELSLFTITHTEDRSRARPVFPAPPGRQPTAVRRDRRDSGKTISGSSDWTRYQITAQVPADADFMGFELTLAGPGTVRLRHVELTRAS